jgi:hypothetical protein
MPILVARAVRRGPIIGLATRMLIVAAVTVSVSEVAAVLPIQEYGATWNVVAVMAFAIVVPALCAIAANYVHWRP